jgi:hypothetical protein
MPEELLYYAYGCRRDNTMEAHGFAGIDEAKRCLAMLIDRGLKFCGVTPTPVTGEQFQKPSLEKAKLQARRKKMWKDPHAKKAWKVKNSRRNKMKVKMIRQQES